MSQYEMVVRFQAWNNSIDLSSGETDTSEIRSGLPPVANYSITRKGVRISSSKELKNKKKYRKFEHPMPAGQARSELAVNVVQKDGADIGLLWKRISSLWIPDPLVPKWMQSIGCWGLFSVDIIQF